MSGMNPLPPHVIHSSTRLTHAQAHFMLNEFLQNTETDAAYRPDSTLTDHGPQSASTGASPNLTLHHLKRILQGIEGKRVGGDNISTLFGELAGANKKQSRKRDAAAFTSSPSNTKSMNANEKRRKFQTMVETVERDGGVEEITQEEDGWVEKDDYEHAQQESQIDVVQEDAHPAGVDQPANEEEAQEEMEVHVEKRGVTKIDKEARKKAKYERKQQEKRERELAKATRSKT